MKKLILLIAFLFLLTLTYSFSPIFNNLFSLHNVVFSDAVYSVYCLDISGSLNSNDIIVLNNGNSFIVKSNINYAEFVKKNSFNVLGESVSFKSDLFSIDRIIKFYNIDVKIKENVADIITIYGYSKNNQFTNSVIIDNEPVNIQIAFKDKKLTIGTPIILGDY